MSCDSEFYYGRPVKYGKLEFCTSVAITSEILQATHYRSLIWSASMADMSCYLSICWASCYFAPLGLQSIVISLSVHLSVCLLSVRMHNSKTTWPNFTKFFVHVACGRGSVLWWRCDNIICFRFYGWCHVFIPLDLIDRWTAWHYIPARKLPLVERRLLWVGWPSSSQAVLLPRQPRTRDVIWAMALQSTWGLLTAYVSSQGSWLSKPALRCGRVAACV